MLSVLIPASNESALIGGCLDAVLASVWTRPGAVQVLVIANGCGDDTADVACHRLDAFAARGWRLDVIERAAGGKLAALNAGDLAAEAESRVYLDADVTVSPELMMQLYDVLDVESPRYASGRLRITVPDNWVSRAYARIYRQVPFMTHGVPGCGLFAVNAVGRARWGDFPDIISDDTYVRLNFAPRERVAVDAAYDWPVVKGLRNLIRVRRRQDIGVTELREHYPDLMRNEGKPPFPTTRKLAMALRDPLGFAVYCGVALAVRLTPGIAAGWSRGR
ncbi:glycosyltransferase [Puniceibacterium sp. IMCC21224]|uniref:glycosyltransferase family 2 protein n=1 Tax=Puniceibacterium sp. IMCC21224 TaxID=1618204 RepID=UPI00064DEDC2|nr:glycosyltransferase [Puniceibacterium sp. IMCC21224]KMK65639.1 Glycosyl transferase family 2 [Puniceibacterium sp. IMCC21224]